MASVRLSVAGMTCGHCQSRVEQALIGQLGVWTAQVDLVTHTAEVDYDHHKTHPDALIAAVHATGYRAKILT